MTSISGSCPTAIWIVVHTTCVTAGNRPHRTYESRYVRYRRVGDIDWGRRPCRGRHRPFAVTSLFTKWCFCIWEPTVRYGGRARCVRGGASPARRRRADRRDISKSLAADPLSCDLLANLHLHLELEVNLDKVVEVRRTTAADVMSLADAVEQALSPLWRSGALDVRLAAYLSAAPVWQVAHPPQGLTHAYAEEPEVRSQWNLDFASSLTRPLRAAGVGRVPYWPAAKPQPDT